MLLILIFRPCLCAFDIFTHSNVINTLLNWSKNFENNNDDFGTIKNNFNKFIKNYRLQYIEDRSSNFQRYKHLFKIGSCRHLSSINNIYCSFLVTIKKRFIIEHPKFHILTYSHDVFVKQLNQWFEDQKCIFDSSVLKMFLKSIDTIFTNLN